MNDYKNIDFSGKLPTRLNRKCLLSNSIINLHFLSYEQSIRENLQHVINAFVLVCI